MDDTILIISLACGAFSVIISVICLYTGADDECKIMDLEERLDQLEMKSGKEASNV